MIGSGLENRAHTRLFQLKERILSGYDKNKFLPEANMNSITSLTNSTHRIPLFWRVCYFIQLCSDFISSAPTVHAHMQLPGRKSDMRWQTNVTSSVL